jgi:triosephosphate isomerase (TIM)
MHKLIIANWKSHQNVNEIKEWLAGFKRQMSEGIFVDENKDEQVAVVIAPSFVNLALVEDFLNQEKQFSGFVSLATQDLSPFAEGSYTGEVGTENLTGHGVKYAIIGHSERRKMFEEDHTQVAKKVAAAVEAGIIPVLCLDEAYIEDQAKEIDQSLYEKCVIAYEPLSAIGSGNNAQVEDVERVVAKIRQVYGDVMVIYGGSVDKSNIQQYITVTDGALVGTASKQADDFVGILKAVAN